MNIRSSESEDNEATNAIVKNTYVIEISWKVRCLNVNASYCK